MRGTILRLLALVACLLSVSCGSNIFEPIANKSSDVACEYETTQNLDNGSWDAVLNSSCADSMQKGAAYFGKAGFDINDVINRFSESGSEKETEDLNVFMNKLVGKVSEESLTNLGSAKTAYTEYINSADPASNSYKDAQFYVGLVDATTSLSYLKTIIDATGLGSIGSCDINNNTAPDEADAAACALIASYNLNYSANEICDGSTYTLTSDLTMTNIDTNRIYTGTYKEVTVTIAGTPTSECLNDYTKLLVRDSVDPSKYWAATSGAGNCQDQNSVPRLCPLEVNNNPVSLVQALDTSLTSAMDSISAALPGTTTTEVQSSINDIKKEYCCTESGESQDSPAACICSELEVSDYIQTLTIE